MGSPVTITPDAPDSVTITPDAQPAAQPTQPGFLDTLGREVSSFGKTIAGTPGAIYHAFADEPTAEETAEYGGPEEVSGAKRVGLGIGRLTVQPGMVAARWYRDAAQGKIPNPVEQALDVAPEAMGAGAAAPVAGKLFESAPAAASKMPAGRLTRVAGKVVKGTIEDIPGVRQVGRLAKYWKETAPEEGKPLLTDRPQGPPSPDPELLQSRSLASASTPKALPASQTGEALGRPPSNVDEFLSEGASKNKSALKGYQAQRGQVAKAAESQPVSADAAKQFARKSLQKMLGDQLEEGLGAEKLDPKAPIATRPDAIPEGHTPVQSSALRSYKYDPGAREFHARATSGDTTYIYGDVAPEDAQAFEQAESKGKAWQQIRQNPLVAKVVNGKRVAVKPGVVATAGSE